MPNKQSLQPCPCCKSGNVKQESGTILCRACGMMVVKIGKGAEAEAREVWNTRATPPSKLKEAVEALRDEALADEKSADKAYTTRLYQSAREAFDTVLTLINTHQAKQHEASRPSVEEGKRYIVVESCLDCLLPFRGKACKQFPAGNYPAGGVPVLPIGIHPNCELPLSPTTKEQPTDAEVDVKLVTKIVDGLKSVWCDCPSEEEWNHDIAPELIEVICGLLRGQRLAKEQPATPIGVEEAVDNIYYHALSLKDGYGDGTLSINENADIFKKEVTGFITNLIKGQSAVEALENARGRMASMENTTASAAQVLEQVGNKNALKQLNRDLGILDTAIKQAEGTKGDG